MRGRRIQGKVFVQNIIRAIFKRFCGLCIADSSLTLLLTLSSRDVSNLTLLLTLSSRDVRNLTLLLTSLVLVSGT